VSDPARDSAAVAAAPAVPLAAAAAMITSGRLTGGLLGDLGDGTRPATELAAYRVQAIAHPLLEAGGYGRQAGWKIGCTTPVMQEYLGIGDPPGDVVLLGSLVQTQWVAAGDVVAVANEPLGEVTAEFTT
jgi:2-keto-4-pentenoate hydratase